MAKVVSAPHCCTNVIEFVTMAPAKSMKEICIAWRIGNASGNGHWFSDARREELAKNVYDQNIRHGAGTHWIKERIA